MKVHHWDDSFRRGQDWESQLDDFFSSWYTIYGVSARQQARGIDRKFVRGNRRIWVEYKADAMAARTGNAFIETKGVSSRLQYKPGWAIRCNADIIIYWVVELAMLYVLNPRQLRAYVRGWTRRHRVVRVKNPNYDGEGVLVPLEEVEAMAIKVMEGPIIKQGDSHETFSGTTQAKCRRRREAAL